MIGQSMINMKSGGRTRLSTLVSGVGLLFLVIVLGDVVQRIPMAALVGVMFMVSIGTFDWSSLKSLRKVPVSDALDMVVTVVAVVATDNLSIGIGVLLSALSFAWKMARIRTSVREEQGVKTYVVAGQLFFGTVSHFLQEFDAAGDPERVAVDFSKSHVWDQSAVNAVSKLILKYRQLGKEIQIIGLNEESSILIERVGLSAPSGH